MAPQVISWQELFWVSEEVDEDTRDSQYTMFATLDRRKVGISFQDVIDSLARTPEEEIFPSGAQGLTRTKRLILGPYAVSSKHKAMHLLPKGFLQEPEAMEVLRGRPHPSILGYQGCFVRPGYITGLVLDRHPDDLEPFMESLESIIRHLHSLGWDRRPVLVDFGSARRIGDKLSTSHGTKDWIDCEMKNYTMSETQQTLQLSSRFVHS
ncbi:hypothetical protein B0J13DRAFT_593031 [Dactylonectria estremocensis]|uniref:Uncharacterized protein n=1 Tax=Dactylonectria estremocensis TaxID=1079267 RepID=A0A9P9F9E7_9HYPO|nr:hypothetical protein B0J13DRAFT_593031 [Dactylonectria estremocensis]